jgi:REP element-mobilizing transposase RayT
MNDNSLRKRKQLRLKEFDYTQPGAYFITICTYWRIPLLCNISGEEVYLNSIGQIVKQCWESIPIFSHFAQTDQFVIMPNHIHGILILTGDNSISTSSANPEFVGSGFPGPSKYSTESLGKIIGRLKYRTTRSINILRRSPGQKVWQRNYYEHVIRNEEDLRICRENIINNPRKWQLDKYYQVR